MSVLHIDLRKTVDLSYDAEIGCDLLQTVVDDLRGGLAGGIRQFVILTDSSVRPLYGEPLLALLLAAGFRADLISFPAGEAHKTRQAKEYAEDTMFALGYRRDCCVIAVGGGMVSDLAGFVAGTYARGVPFLVYATTLLAAADAAVGGKTAVNTDAATNAIGLFHQPRKVYLDVAAWKTLDRRQLASGLAETVKHACIADAEFFRCLSAHADAILRLDEAVCRSMTEKNCTIKQKIVAADERERGMREMLNLGHTLGRALESLCDYRLLHGEAVSVGLIAAYRLSEKLGFCSEADTAAVSALLRSFALPTALPCDIDRTALLEKLYTDKKVRNGTLRFVLPRGIGAIAVTENGQYAHPVGQSLVREVLQTL